MKENENTITVKRHDMDPNVYFVIEYSLTKSMESILTPEGLMAARYTDADLQKLRDRDIIIKIWNKGKP